MAEKNKVFYSLNLMITCMGYDQVRFSILICMGLCIFNCLFRSIFGLSLCKFPTLLAEKEQNNIIIIKSKIANNLTNY